MLQGPTRAVVTKALIVAEAMRLACSMQEWTQGVPSARRSGDGAANAQLALEPGGALPWFRPKSEITGACRPGCCGASCCRPCCDGAGRGSSARFSPDWAALSVPMAPPSGVLLMSPPACLTWPWGLASRLACAFCWPVVLVTGLARPKRRAVLGVSASGEQASDQGSEKFAHYDSSGGSDWKNAS